MARNPAAGYNSSDEKSSTRISLRNPRNLRIVTAEEHELTDLYERENYIKNARFQGPKWVPSAVVISGASWDEHREAMEEVCIRHPLFFPGVRKGWRDYDNHVFPVQHRANEVATDTWGCDWVTSTNGIIGAVVNAPLANWDDLDTYQIPDANVMLDWGPIDWAAERARLTKQRQQGNLIRVGTAHGFLYLRLQYLRGFENLMIDIATDEPRLHTLIDRIVEHNMVIVRNYVDIGVDEIFYADDLGTQTATFISPADFRKWLKPAYAKLMQPCKDAGVLCGFHSDGRTLDILIDQIEAGVDMVNPQDLCNGIDNLARYIKGRACINLDIDRQTIVPYGTRQEIFDLIEEEVRKLGDPSGGLMFICGIYPPTPPANVDALCCALEKYMTYWWE